nr:gtpase-binding protein rid1 [Quercus suber]
MIWNQQHVQRRNTTSGHTSARPWMDRNQERSIRTLWRRSNWQAQKIVNGRRRRLCLGIRATSPFLQILFGGKAPVTFHFLRMRREVIFFVATQDLRSDQRRLYGATCVSYLAISLGMRGQGQPTVLIVPLTGVPVGWSKQGRYSPVVCTVSFLQSLDFLALHYPSLDNPGDSAVIALEDFIRDFSNPTAVVMFTVISCHQEQKVLFPTLLLVTTIDEMQVKMEPTVEHPKRPQHRRNASSKSNILRSLVTPKARPADLDRSGTPPSRIAHGRTKSMPFLPPDHPHSTKPKALAERQGNVRSPPSSPSKSRTSAAKAVKIPTKHQDGNQVKRSKSSTNLGAVFAKLNRSSKDLPAMTQDKNKENETPPNASTIPAETPIWAQFASTNAITGEPASQPDVGDSRVFVESGKVQNEIAKYTPKEYSPSKQRNFNGSYETPSLRPGPNSRPQSVISYGEGLVGAIGRRVSGARMSFEGRKSEDSGRRPTTELRRTSSDGRHIFGRRQSVDRTVSGGSVEQAPPKDKLNVAKRGGRVMAAVAVLQGKNRAEPTKDEPVLDPRSIDEAFEAVLDSRNIPEPMRRKMRNLTLRVKQDFVKQDQGSKTIDGTNPDTSDANAREQPEADLERQAAEVDGKSTKRSRGRTFTFSKSDKRSGDASPSKKARSQSKSGSLSVNVPKESTSTKSPLTTPTTPFGSLGRRSAPLAIPGDYITYLKNNQDPAKVEVGRLHKLRILLRNETVAWVDSFVSMNGMAEIVGLLYRTMAVEWREEHEDQLLHETLLCLKGLCTTGSAMIELEKEADSLFPALLGMLFDEEKKGPAEYATRTIIINVLCKWIFPLFYPCDLSPLTSFLTVNFLASAIPSSPAVLEQRARKILTYLGEPTKPEDVRPVDFVLDMHTPRPYKLWAREVSNVTREVFWIFLHHLNVIPAPKTKTSSLLPSVEDAQHSDPCEAAYTSRHFPSARAPIPAAPYIGGVEWDATTYIAAHLDLLNGLVASLPNTATRNALRTDLQLSGFEKIMAQTLRTCKEKFYSSVHDGLKAWVAAAIEDEWETQSVREGPPPKDDTSRRVSPEKSPKKKAKDEDAPPKLEIAPLLDLKIGHEAGTGNGDDEGWLE